MTRHVYMVKIWQVEAFSTPEGKPCLAKQLDVAGLAVGVVAVLLEGPFVEQLEAEGAREVLRVPLLAHCRYALACRGRERGEGGEKQRGRRGIGVIQSPNNSSTTGHITS